MKRLRILVTGGRDYRDLKRVEKELLALLPEGDPKNAVLCTGGARGADDLAFHVGSKHGILQKLYEADWNRYGRSAGAIRNQEMLDKFKPDIVLAFPGGNGTADMCYRAAGAGVPIKYVKENHETHSTR